MTDSWIVSPAWSRKGWSVRRTGSIRVTRNYVTKRAAINAAVRWGRRDKVSVYISQDRYVKGRPMFSLLYPSDGAFLRWLRADSSR